MATNKPKNKNIVLRAAFAAMAGVSPSYVNNYIRRGDLVLYDDERKYLDITHPKNKWFLDKRNGGTPSADEISHEEIELPDIEELFPEFMKMPDYCTQAENEMEKLMLKWGKAKKPYQLISFSLVQQLTACYFIEKATDEMRQYLNRMQSAKNQADFKTIIAKYSQYCRSTTLDFLEGFSEHINEINDHRY